MSGVSRCDRFLCDRPRQEVRDAATDPASSSTAWFRSPEIAQRRDVDHLQPPDGRPRSHASHHSFITPVPVPSTLNSAVRSQVAHGNLQKGTGS